MGKKKAATPTGKLMAWYARYHGDVKLTAHERFEFGCLCRELDDMILGRKGAMRGLRLYEYAFPNAMTGHDYTDDVAICWAKSKKDAVRKFQKLYGLADETNVSKVSWTDCGVAILTDY